MSDPLGAALQPFVAALEELVIPYYVGGSVASMTHGEYRMTADVDIVADIKPEHVAPLVEKLSGEFLVDEEALLEAIARRSSFNAIHLTEFFKVDVFALKDRDYDREVVRRRVRETVESDPPVEAFLSSPEDVVLAKLEWYRLGNETSERQWRDVLGVLKMQCFDIDIDYLEKWAREIGVADLLERALDEAGLKNKETDEHSD